MRHKVVKLLAVALSVGLGQAALAADMPVKAPMVQAVASYNWTGCYIGGNVGGGWARIDQRQVGKVTGTVLDSDFGSGSDSKFIGGGQIGCDYQFASNWLVGVQGMFDFGNINSTHTLTAFPTFYSDDTTKNMFTATARLGYLVTPAVLGYVKGGGAWTRTDSSVYGTAPAKFLSETANGVNRQGWTIGGGVEWMFAPNWSVFAEYNYMDFGRRNINYVQTPGTVGLADVVSTRLTVQQALLGINYRFNFGR